MKYSRRLRDYEAVRRALQCEPHETLHMAAVRVERQGWSGPRRATAKLILAAGGAPMPWFWIQRAAARLRERERRRSKPVLDG